MDDVDISQLLNPQMIVRFMAAVIRQQRAKGNVVAPSPGPRPPMAPSPGPPMAPVQPTRSPFEPIDYSNPDPAPTYGPGAYSIDLKPVSEDRSEQRIRKLEQDNNRLAGELQEIKGQLNKLLQALGAQ